MELNKVDCIVFDKPHHDDVDDDWKEGYYEMKESESLQLNKETGYFEKVK